MSTTPPQKKRQKIHGRRPKRAKQSCGGDQPRPEMRGYVVRATTDALAASLERGDGGTSFA